MFANNEREHAVAPETLVGLEKPTRGSILFSDSHLILRFYAGFHLFLCLQLRRVGGAEAQTCAIRGGFSSAPGASRESAR